jgi:hypothetical protein
MVVVVADHRPPARPSNAVAQRRVHITAIDVHELAVNGTHGMGLLGGV